MFVSPRIFESAEQLALLIGDEHRISNICMHSGFHVDSIKNKDLKPNQKKKTNILTVSLLVSAFKTSFASLRIISARSDLVYVL